jgi:hypothetical protein
VPANWLTRGLEKFWNGEGWRVLGLPLRGMGAAAEAMPSGFRCIDLELGTGAMGLAPFRSCLAISYGGTEVQQVADSCDLKAVRHF